MPVFKLVIVTPQKPVLECEAEYVTLPAAGGQFGVLARHSPYAVQLVEGLLRYKKPGGEDGEFAVMGGFAEINGKEVSVFAEAAELAAEINEENQRQELQRSKDILAAKSKDVDIETVQAQLRRAAVRLNLKQRSQKRHTGGGRHA
ncbi:MAG: ATP synthase F1 subunit epsilon [Elusimicrobia bacterium]|nr:ATP synthase F1 subunit epsilon [Elusimicrobiota bacterium]